MSSTIRKELSEIITGTVGKVLILVDNSVEYRLTLGQSPRLGTTIYADHIPGRL